jgi:S1-C subfamily serine protease
MTTRHNHRSSRLFHAPTDGRASRPLNFDEVRCLAGVVTHLCINTRKTNQFFQLQDVLHSALQMASNAAGPAPFVRPAYELMQRFVSLGAVVDITPHDVLNTDLLVRRYRSGVEYTLDEWATQQLAADAIGLPYVAQQYAPLVVRVLAPRSEGDPGMATGLVLGSGLIVTNRHVIENAQSPEEIAVSWGNSPEVPCIAFKGHDDTAIDLAVLAVPGFEAHPFPWLRDPAPAEEVVALAYPLVPQVIDPRPQLVFTGTVATSESVTTFWGTEQSIINAVMPPGASGGPIFGKDGRLVGLVVRTLDGQTLEDGAVLASTLHAFIPSGILLRELPKLHPQFTFLNRFATTEESAAVIAAHEDKWWEVST